MLRATRAIVERPGALPVRVGVNTGRVFAGIVGTLTRRTYTFYGDAINTAARIMVRAADGQLLAREDVLERARTTYAATPIEPFAAKGKAELVRASDVGDGRRRARAGGDRPVRRAGGRARHAARGADAGGRGAGRARDRDRGRGTRQDAAAGRAVRTGGGCQDAARAVCADGSEPPLLGRRGVSCCARSSSTSTLRRPPSSAASAPRSPQRIPSPRAVAPAARARRGTRPSGDARDRWPSRRASSPSASRRPSRRCSTASPRMRR